MQFQDQSLGFEISLPEGWRKLFIFEQVNKNVFKTLLPPSLADGPVLVGPEKGSIVITIQQIHYRTPEDYHEQIRKIAEKSDLHIRKLDEIVVQKELHATVIWKKKSDDRLLKTYFIHFGKLLWSLTLLLDEEEGYYDQMIETFDVLPLVRKMME